MTLPNHWAQHQHFVSIAGHQNEWQHHQKTIILWNDNRKTEKTNWILGQSREKNNRIQFLLYHVVWRLLKHVEMIYGCNTLYDTVLTSANTKAGLNKFLKFHSTSVCFIFIDSSNNTIIITYADRLVASRFQYISSLLSTFASHLLHLKR